MVSASFRRSMGCNRGDELVTLPEKSELSDDLLYLFVLGPGTGESVLIRIPSEKWVIIDSFRCGRPSRAAADYLLSKYGGEVAAIVLTHPHQDHYSGIVDLIEKHAGARLGCVHPQDSGYGPSLTPDTVRALKQGAKPAYTRIWDEWEKAPPRQWATFRNASITIEDAKITSLHPTRPIARTMWNGSRSNEISSAMLVEWNGLRLLLGADVPNSQWPGIAAAFPGLNDHAALKVPHHGSREAIHEAFGDGDASRLWLVTPFRKQRLPRSDDSAKDGAPEGMARCLLFVNEIRLTALPFRHDLEQERACATTRPQIRDNVRPQRTGSVDENLMATTAALDRHLILGFDAVGKLRDQYAGPGTVYVSEG